MSDQSGQTKSILDLKTSIDTLETNIKTLDGIIYNFSKSSKSDATKYSVSAMTNIMTSLQGYLTSLYTSMWNKAYPSQQMGTSTISLANAITLFGNIFTEMDSKTLILDTTNHTLTIPANYHNSTTNDIVVNSERLGYSASTATITGHAAYIPAGVVETDISLDAYGLGYNESIISFNTSTDCLLVTLGIVSTSISLPLTHFGVPEVSIDINTTTHKLSISLGYVTNDQEFSLVDLGLSTYTIDWDSSNWCWIISPGYSNTGSTLYPREMIPASTVSYDTSLHTAYVESGLVEFGYTILKLDLGIQSGTFTANTTSHYAEITAGVFDDANTVTRETLGYEISTPSFNTTAHTASLPIGVVLLNTIITLNDTHAPTPSSSGSVPLETDIEYCAASVGYIYAQLKSTEDHFGFNGYSKLIVNNREYSVSGSGSLDSDSDIYTCSTIIPILVNPGDRFSLLTNSTVATLSCDNGVLG